MRIAELKETVEILEGVSVVVSTGKVIVKGQHGEATRTWRNPKVDIKVEGNEVVLSSKNASKNQKRDLETTKAHIQNLVNGVKNGNEYKMKVCSSHFPVQVSMDGQTLVVKNFFGEKIPRRTELPKDAQVKIQADKISVTGPDIEKVGQVVSMIEQTCRITNKDRRRFQDGIYLTEKNGKPV
jgi:large subunit ribosomal protein L6